MAGATSDKPQRRLSVWLGGETGQQELGVKGGGQGAGLCSMRYAGRGRAIKLENQGWTQDAGESQSYPHDPI